jgi:hypothetical protein
MLFLESKEELSGAMYITDFKIVSLHIADFSECSHYGRANRRNLFHRIKGVYRVIS